MLAFFDLNTQKGEIFIIANFANHLHAELPHPGEQGTTQQCEMALKVVAPNIDPKSSWPQILAQKKGILY